MKNIYRVSVFNRSTGKRELIYEQFTSRKKAQIFADMMNKADITGEIQAVVIKK